MKLEDKLLQAIKALQEEVRLNDQRIRQLTRPVGTSGGAGVRKFTDLEDTPSSYSGAIGKFVKVNLAGSGLTFEDIGAARWLAPINKAVGDGEMPQNPGVGDRFLIIDAGTGEWDGTPFQGHGGQIATWNGSGWDFYSPEVLGECCACAEDRSIWIYWGVGVAGYAWRIIKASEAYPSAHAITHKNSGSDMIRLDELGWPTDNTNLDVSIYTHGLCPKLPNDGTKYLNGLGQWTVPSGGSGGGPNIDFGVWYIYQQTYASFLVAQTDAFWQEEVLGIINSPPSSPELGERYIVGTSPSGAFSGHANEIATYFPSTGWQFFAPWAGVVVFNYNDGLLYRFDGSSWGLWSATTTRQGLVPPLPSSGGTTKFLRADGTWAVPSAAASFLDLTDTPSSYYGHALKLVRVKSDESGLEFYQWTLPSHASSHKSGGSDAIKLDELATPDDNTNLNATTQRHGLLPKLSGSTSQFLRGDGAWAVPEGGGGGGGGSEEIEVAQANHGFAVCDVIRLTSSGYVKAQADSEEHAEVVGVVSGVVDSDNFKFKPQGVVSSIFVPNEPAGTVLYLSPTTAGALTTTEPTEIGQVSKPVAIVLEPETSMVVLPLRGLAITGISSVHDDVSAFRKKGTSGFEAWHTVPMSNTAATTGALTANRLYAFPFVVPEDITLDRLAMNVTTASSGSKLRFGIYDSDVDNFPANLIIDSGEQDSGTTGIKSVTINQLLRGGKLYWLVCVSSGTPTVRCAAVSAMLTPQILGTSSALGTTLNLGLYASYTYGALPSTFPSTVTMITGAPIPLVFFRIAATA